MKVIADLSIIDNLDHKWYYRQNAGVKNYLDKLNFCQDKYICSPNVRQASKKIQCKGIFP